MKVAIKVFLKDFLSYLLSSWFAGSLCFTFSLSRQGLKVPFGAICPPYTTADLPVRYLHLPEVTWFYGPTR